MAAKKPKPEGVKPPFVSEAEKLAKKLADQNLVGFAVSHKDLVGAADPSALIQKTAEAAIKKQAEVIQQQAKVSKLGLDSWASYYKTPVNLQSGDSVQITETVSMDGGATKPLEKAPDADGQDTEKLMSIPYVQFAPYTSSGVALPAKKPPAKKKVHELAEAIVYDEAKHPRWPPGTVDFQGKKIGGEYMAAGQTFMHGGQRWEIQAIADGHVIANEASGEVEQAETKVFDPKMVKFDDGEHPTIPGVEVAPSEQIKSGKGKFVQEYNSPVFDGTHWGGGKHDPSIPLPAKSDLTADEWKQFGKADQLYYRELQKRYGKWGFADKHLLGKPRHLTHKANAAMKKGGDSDAISLLQSVMESQKGNSTGSLLDLSNVFDDYYSVDGSTGLDKARKRYEKGREAEQELNGVIAWDLYNRTHAPALTVVHRNGESEKWWSDVMHGKTPMMSGLPTTWTTSWKYGEPNVLSFAMPIRNIALAQDLVGGFGDGYDYEHEIANANRMKIDADSAVYWPESSETPPAGTVYAWIDGQLKQHPQVGQVVRNAVAHLQGKMELPLPEASSNFKIIQKPGTQGYEIPSAAFMSKVEHDMGLDSGKIISDYEPVSQLDLKPGDVIATSNTSTRYLVIADTSAPTGMSYVQLLTGTGDYESKKFTFSSWDKARYKVDKHFDIPVTKPVKPVKYSADDWKPGGDKTPVAKLEIGDKIRINGQDWQIEHKETSSITLKSLTSDEKATVNPAWKTQKLVASAYNPKVGEMVVAHPHGKPSFVATVLLTGKLTSTVVTPAGVEQTFPNAMLTKLGLADIEPQKGDTFAHDGKKYTVTRVLKNGTVNAKATGGKVQPFKPGAPALMLLLRPSDYSLGEGQKLGSVVPGTLVSGSPQVVRPYMVLGKQGKQTFLVNLDTGEHSTVSSYKSYKLLAHKDDVQPEAVTMDVPHDQWSVGDVVPASGLQVGDGFVKNGTHYTVVTNVGDGVTVKPDGGVPQIMGKQGTVTYSGLAPVAEPTAVPGTFEALKVGDKFKWKDGPKPDVTWTVQSILGSGTIVSQGDDGSSNWFMPTTEPVEVLSSPAGPTASGSQKITGLKVGDEFEVVSTNTKGWWGDKPGPYKLVKNSADTYGVKYVIADAAGEQHSFDEGSSVGVSTEVKAIKSDTATAVDPGQLPTKAIMPFAYSHSGKKKHPAISTIPEGDLFTDKKGDVYKVKQQGPIPIITDGQSLLVAPPTSFVNHTPDAAFTDNSPPISGPEKLAYDQMLPNDQGKSIGDLELDEQPGAQIWWQGKALTLQPNGYWQTTVGSNVSLPPGTVPQRYTAPDPWTDAHATPVATATSLGLAPGDQIITPSGTQATLIYVGNGVGFDTQDIGLDSDGDQKFWVSLAVKKYKKAQTMIPAKDLNVGDTFLIHGFTYTLVDKNGNGKPPLIKLPNGTTMEWADQKHPDQLPDVEVEKIPTPAKPGTVAALGANTEFKTGGQSYTTTDGKVWNTSTGAIIVVKDAHGVAMTLSADTTPDVEPQTPPGELKQADLTPFGYPKSGTSKHPPVHTLEPGDIFKDKQGKQFVLVSHGEHNGVKGSTVVDSKQEFAFVPEKTSQGKPQYVKKVGEGDIPEGQQEAKPGSDTPQKVAWKDLPVGAQIKTGSPTYGYAVIEKTSVSSLQGKVVQILEQGTGPYGFGNNKHVGDGYVVGNDSNTFEVYQPDPAAQALAKQQKMTWHEAPVGTIFKTHSGTIVQKTQPSKQLPQPGWQDANNGVIAQDSNGYTKGQKWYAGNGQNAYTVVTLGTTTGKKLNELQKGEVFTPPTHPWFNKKTEPPNITQWQVVASTPLTLRVTPIGGTGKAYIIHKSSEIGALQVPDQAPTAKPPVAQYANDPLLAFFHNQFGSAPINGGNLSSTVLDNGTFLTYWTPGKAAQPIALLKPNAKTVVVNEQANPLILNKIVDYKPADWHINYLPESEISVLISGQPTLKLAANTPIHVGEYGPDGLPPAFVPNDKPLADLPVGTYYALDSGTVHKTVGPESAGQEVPVITANGTQQTASGYYVPPKVALPEAQKMKVADMQPGDIFAVGAKSPDASLTWQITGPVQANGEVPHVVHTDLTKHPAVGAAASTPADFAAWKVGHEPLTSSNLSAPKPPVAVKKHATAWMTQHDLPPSKQKLIHATAANYKKENPAQLWAKAYDFAVYSVTPPNSPAHKASGIQAAVEGTDELAAALDASLAQIAPELPVTHVGQDPPQGFKPNKRKLSDLPVGARYAYQDPGDPPGVWSGGIVLSQDPLKNSTKPGGMKYDGIPGFAPSHAWIPPKKPSNFFDHLANGDKALYTHPATGEQIPVIVTDNQISGTGVEVTAPGGQTYQAESGDLSPLEGPTVWDPDVTPEDLEPADAESFALPTPLNAVQSAANKEKFPNGVMYKGVLIRKVTGTKFDLLHGDTYVTGGKAIGKVKAIGLLKLLQHGGHITDGHTIVAGTEPEWVKLAEKTPILQLGLMPGDKARLDNGAEVTIVAVHVPSDSSWFGQPDGMSGIDSQGKTLALASKFATHIKHSPVEPGVKETDADGNVTYGMSGSQITAAVNDAIGAPPQAGRAEPGTNFNDMAMGQTFSGEGGLWKKVGQTTATLVKKYPLDHPEYDKTQIASVGEDTPGWAGYVVPSQVDDVGGATSSAQTAQGENIWVGDTVYSLANPGVKYTVTGFAGDDVHIKGPNNKDWTVKGKTLTKHVAFGGKPLSIGDHVITVAPETKNKVVEVSALNKDGTIDVVDNAGDLVASHVPVAGVQHTTSPLPAPAEKPVTIPDYSLLPLGNEKPAGGSTGAVFAYHNLHGPPSEYLIKRYGGDQERVATELLANRIYRALGITVPDAGVYQPDAKQPTALAYPTMAGKVVTGTWTGTMKKKFAQGYVADALLGSYDHIGLERDNVLWQGAGMKPIRVDQGGTFFYRAQGKKKPYKPTNDELTTMLTVGQAGQNGLGSYLTAQDIRDQAEHVATVLTPGKIDQLVDAMPFNDALMRDSIRQNLKARVLELAKYADGSKALPEALLAELHG